MYLTESSYQDINAYSRRGIEFLGASIGVINNNPGNIRDTATVQFRGELEPRQGFKRFKNIDYGYRALIKNLQAYIVSGHNTINKMILRWAPWGDGNNNPDRYAKNVSKRTGIKLHTKIDATDYASLQNIANAISIQEIGASDIAAIERAGSMLMSETGSMGATFNITGRKARPWLLLIYPVLMYAGNQYNKKNPVYYRGKLLYK